MQQAISKAFTWYSDNIYKIIYYTFAFLLALVFLERLCIIFSYEGHTAGIDNNFDYPIIRSLAGYSIYPNPSEYPFAVNPYAPLFFISCKWVASLLHLDPSNTISIYKLSRSVCLLADTGTSILFFIILRKYAKANAVATVALVSIFFCIISYLGYTINRSDSFFLFFYCYTLFILVKYEENKKVFAAFAAALLTAFCIFSKQNGIGLLAITSIWFLIGKNYRPLFIYLLFSSFLLIAIFCYFQFVYSNHFFSQHVINSLKNRIDPRWFYVYIMKLISSTYLTLPLSIAFIISVQSIGQNLSLTLKKLGYVFIFQLIFSIALCFKWGSSLGYFNESFLVGLIIIAFFYAKIVRNKTDGNFKWVGVYTFPAIAIFLFHMVAQLFFFFINSREDGQKRFTEQVQIRDYIQKGIGNKNKYVIDLSNADFNFFKNLLFKESAVPNIDAVKCCTLPDKIFDYSGLLKGLQNGQIMFLIKEKGANDPTVWGINIEHYRIDSSFTRYSVYKYDSLLLKHNNRQGVILSE